MTAVGGDSFIIKTPAEQRLEQLRSLAGERRLTNDEWEAVRKAEHAIYCRHRRLREMA